MDVSRWQTSLGTLGTSICHVGSSLANGLSSLAVDSTDREKVSFVTFSHLEYTSSKPNSSGLIRRPVLLIGYTTGFQVWDLGSGAPNVLVSRREGPVRYERHCPAKSSLYSYMQQDLRTTCTRMFLPASDTQHRSHAATGGRHDRLWPPMPASI